MVSGFFNALLDVGGLWLDLWLWVLTRFDDKPNWMAYTAIAVLLALHIGPAALLIACLW